MAQTEYPPEAPTLMQKPSAKVIMLVDSVSPGPFALLRRANNFEYRDEDLQIFSEYSDPAQALTEECRRVLHCIASANQSTAARSQSGMSIGLETLNNQPDESWSHFQDFGFSSIDDNPNHTTSGASSPALERPRLSGLRSAPHSRAADGGRPTTPSWADFLNSGFVDEGTDVGPTPVRMLLPPDKVLPPIGNGPPRSSNGYNEEDVTPGELASITRFDLDDSFWWVWITSLANEEPSGRKAVFGRCALIETGILTGRWILLEEQIKSAAPAPEEGAYLAEKKSRFGFSRRGKAQRRRSAALPQKSDNPHPQERETSTAPNKASISPDQQARVRAAAATLVRQNKKGDEAPAGQRRGRHDDAASFKTNSVLTLGLTSEAAPAMKWAHTFDKEAMRKQYLGDNFAGKGTARDIHIPENAGMYAEAKNLDKPLPSPSAQKPSIASTDRDLPPGSGQDTENAKSPASAALVNASAALDEVPPSLSASIRSEQPVVHNATEMPAAPSVPKITNVGRKPVPPRSDNIQNHPAFRPSTDGQRPNVETPAEKAAREAWEAKAASFRPEVLAHENKRPGGFRRMFSRRDKSDENTRNSSATPSASMTSLAPPSETSLGRKLSLLRKKSNTPTPPVQPAAVAAEPLFPRRPVAGSPAAPSEPSPRVVSPFEPTLSDQQYLGADISPLQPSNRSQAEEEFQRFDQGPLSDAPAWTPRESIDSGLQAEEAHKADLEAGHLNAPGGFPETPAETPLELGNNGQSETEPVYDSTQPVANNLDRWAQIRKNAAERAARLSEDQISRRPSHFTGTEDEGDTSGEETIEERVARIKARVAHLTGSMETVPPMRKF